MGVHLELAARRGHHLSVPIAELPRKGWCVGWALTILDCDLQLGSLRIETWNLAGALGPFARFVDGSAATGCLRSARPCWGVV